MMRAYIIPLANKPSQHLCMVVHACLIISDQKAIWRTFYLQSALPITNTVMIVFCSHFLYLLILKFSYFYLFLSFVILRNNWNTFVIFHHRKKKLRVNNNCQASGQLRLWSTTASYILYS